MNISTNKLPNQTLEVSIEILPEDYEKPFLKKLYEARSRYDVKGFRRGYAPIPLIKRLFGERALLEAIEQVQNDALNDFAEQNGSKFDFIGNFFPSPDSPENDFKDGNSFVFKYQIAIVDFEPFTVGKDDVLTEYSIKVPEEAVKYAEESILASYGSQQETEAAGEEDVVVVDLTQGETLRSEVSIMVNKTQGEGHAHFLGAKPGDTFEVNVNETFTNEADRASILDVKKEELEGIDPMYTVTVVRVLTFVPAASCQETWDKVFGEGKVTSEEQWKEAVYSYAATPYVRQASSFFAQEARRYFMEKSGVKVNAGIVRSLIKRSGQIAADKLDEEVAGEVNTIKWNSVKEHILAQFGQTISDEEVEMAGKSYLQDYYSSYGFTDEIIDSQVESMMSDKNQYSFFRQMAVDQKVFSLIHSNVTLRSEEVTYEEFGQKVAPKPEPKDEPAQEQ